MCVCGGTGIYEFVKKGDYPVMGVTKLTPEAMQRMAAKKYKFMPTMFQQAAVAAAVL